MFSNRTALALAMLTAAASNSSPDHFATALDRHTFDDSIKEGHDWVVVYCDESEPCEHFIGSFRKLTTTWTFGGQFTGAQFGEVTCSQDMSLCDREGLDKFPAAVRYRKGTRIASFKVDGERPSAVWQFLSWIKAEMAPSKEPETFQVDDVTFRRPSSFLDPIGGMDDETLAVGCVLLLGAVASVTWVIVEGFELWPATAGKVEPSSPSDSFIGCACSHSSGLE